MSVADEFVKRLAAVKCDHRRMLAAGPAFGNESFGDVADREAKAEAARCLFCIARATLESDESREVVGRSACYSIVGEPDKPENHRGGFSQVGNRVLCHNCNHTFEAPPGYLVT